MLFRSNPTYGSLVAYFQTTDVIKLTDATTGYSALIQINAIQSPYSTSNAYIQVATSSLSSFAASTGSNWTFQQWSPSVYTQTQVSSVNRQSSVSLRSIDYSKEYNSYWAATYAPINRRRPAPNNSLFLLSSTLGVPSDVVPNYHLSRYPINYSPDYVYKSVSVTTALSWSVVDYYTDITTVPEIVSSTQGSTPSTTTIYFDKPSTEFTRVYSTYRDRKSTRLNSSHT